MIVSENVEAAAKSFVPVLDKAVLLLKTEASRHTQRYIESSGTRLEGLVLEALNEAARRTEFDGSIRLASGLRFPDIVLEAGGIGVEVKSTTRNHWTTTGNSVLESTRIPNIGKIFLMFGKLVSPIDFKVRLYEECLKEVLVTHYPRYQIDMNLPDGETIFDKIGMSYDELRVLQEPISPIIKYYSSILRPGESLWWAGNSKARDQSSPMTIRELSSLEQNERADVVARSFVLFPQLFGRGQDKFHDVLVWLLRKGIICGNIRDFYTAGGKWRFVSSGGNVVELPQIFKRFYDSKERFVRSMAEADVLELEYSWRVDLKGDDRLGKWLSIVRKHIGRDGGHIPLEKMLAAGYPSRFGISSRSSLAGGRLLQGMDVCKSSCDIVDSAPSRLRFREYLPLYSLRAACGYFGDGEFVECEGWVKVENCGKLDNKMFIVRASGRSMEPKICNGDLCVMRADPQGSREGKIVLAQHREIYDPDAGGAYSIKRFSSKKRATNDGSWRHDRIMLSPINPDYKPIVINSPDDCDCKIIAELVRVL